MMDAANGNHLEGEVQALEGALAALDAAIERLREADETVGGLLAQASETVAMPNSRRAEQQMRTALNASAGARTALKRRLELRRGVLEQRRRRSGDTT